MVRIFVLVCCLVVGFAPLWQAPAFAQPHSHSLVAEYVPWGVDEYELFGLSRADLAAKYKDTLEYDDAKSTVYFVGYRRPGFGQPQYIVTFAGGKIDTVKRLFIDGGGCHIVGPVFKTKRDAINFGLSGLLKNENRSAKTEEHIKELRKALADLDKPSKPSQAAPSKPATQAAGKKSI